MEEVQSSRVEVIGMPQRIWSHLVALVPNDCKDAARGSESGLGSGGVNDRQGEAERFGAMEPRNMERGGGDRQSEGGVFVVYMVNILPVWYYLPSIVLVG